MTANDCGGETPPTAVPADHVFVMGDNRPQSQDSRAIGPIDEDDLVGRAFVVFWPVNRVASLSVPDTFDAVPAPSGG